MTEHETLDLYEAADFLKMHWQTLRERAVAGLVPGAKLGKRWVFLKDDLVSCLRSHYSTSRPRSQVQHLGESLCCTNDQPRPTGGANLPHPTEDEYDNLLKR
ncbi:MAG: hypothetical protein DHS20C12_10700 [Pseudohongiella sp.]|nr:MAG: hypothetical protein DHS20C12_10700 [Pseudohongiella sp.]